MDGQRVRSETAGFGDQQYAADEGGTVNISFHIRTEGFSYRNVTWFVYLAEPPSIGPLWPENASLLLPVRGPLTVPEDVWTNFTFDLHLPNGLTGMFVMGMTWGGTHVDVDGDTRELSPGRDGVAAAYALEIRPRSTGGTREVAGPPAAAIALVALAGALLMRRRR